ncbi:MAG: nitroreductase family protein [Planctomycetota bacterium]
MQRPAQTEYPIHDLLKQRWSPLAFADEPVTEAQLNSLLEAARWAPSCYNEQPWSFVVATRDRPEDFARVLSCLVEPNQAWVRHAPVLMIVVAKRHFDRNGHDNRHAWYDVGQAVALLSVQATALGLFVHQMAGFSPDQARTLLQIPDSHEPTTAVAIGHYGRPERLTAELWQREEGPRQRRPVRDFLFLGRWAGGAKPSR